jgi:hypothetical protein
MGRLTEALYDMVVFVHHETDSALLVSEDHEDRKGAVWLPKSKIEIAPKAKVNGILYHDLTVPEWLAIEKGLV